MTDRPDDPAGGKFHWDKRVPVTLLGVILVTTLVNVAAASFWGGQFLAKQDATASQVAEHGTRIERLERELVPLREVLTELTAEIRNLNRRLDDLGRRQDRMEERRP